MKKKWKKVVVIVIVIAALIALVPYQIGTLKDGGSKTLKSLTYNIVRYHKLKPVGMGNDGYFNGWRIEIFGRTLCDDYEDYRQGLEPVDLALPEGVTDEEVTALDAEDELPPDDDLYEPIPVPEPETDPIDYGDGDIPDSTVSFAPSGFYSSESGEYAMFFAPDTTTAPTGELSLEKDGEITAWGDYRTEEVIYNGISNYYIWLTVKGLDAPVDDIHIANYYPDDDLLLQLEYIEVSNGALTVGCPPADPDADSDFGVVLVRADGIE